MIAIFVEYPERNVSALYIQYDDLIILNADVFCGSHELTKPGIIFSVLFPLVSYISYFMRPETLWGDRVPVRRAGSRERDKYREQPIITRGQSSRSR